MLIQGLLDSDGLWAVLTDRADVLLGSLLRFLPKVYH
jgi:hypothetical protein